ncbi:MAG: aminoacyl-tRNA hydrolase [Calditerrivibrio sp.]|nr:aminoacyl-tRNA hydrolase [Calditerrivibrio sp.]
MNNRWIVVGLGNPGSKYALTRHNIGFMVIDMVVERFCGSYRGGFEADYTVLDIYGKRCYLVKPQTYMNLSGKSVVEICGYFDIPFTNMVVVHDDLDMEFGKIKIKKGGSSGGHRGVDSIIAASGWDDFIRVKMGIGKPVNKDISGYVLSEFDRTEKGYLKEFIDLGADALLALLEKGVQVSMNLYNNKKIVQEVNQK